LFVTRDREPENCRARDPLRPPAITPNYKISGILAVWPMAGKGILKVRMKAE